MLAKLVVLLITITRAWSFAVQPDMNGQASRVSDVVKDAISSHEVLVFSKSYCPYCAKTKSLFSQLELKAHVIELDEREDGAAIQQALLEITGQRTVPNVFIKGKHLGGNDDTQRANAEGRLLRMLE